MSPRIKLTVAAILFIGASVAVSNAHSSRSLTIGREHTLTLRGSSIRLSHFAASQAAKYPSLDWTAATAVGAESVTINLPDDIKQAELLRITDDAIRHRLSYSLHRSTRTLTYTQS